MTRPHSGDAARRDKTQADNPWARWGWLMWIVWLLFLIFPAVSVMQDPTRSLGWRLAGLTLIVTFGVLYVIGAWRIMESGDFSDRTVAGFLLALLAVTLISGLVIGFQALGFTPFLVSFGAFCLKRPWHWLFGIAVVIATVAVIALGDQFDGWGYFLVILVSVGVGVNVARLLVDQSFDYDQVQSGLAISEERERVARDVHDVLGHSLTAVSVKAGLAERLVDVDPERAKAEIADIARIARESLAEVRSTVGGLRAARLSSELEQARSSLASAGIVADVDDDAQVVDPAHRTVLGWVLREAVTNVVRHSKAQTCRVDLNPHSLVVEDDGVGIGDRRMGNGLHGLRERVEAAGGRLDVGPGSDGRGTRLEVSWPT